jgi:NADH:ubiquinone oxidoreductase subunit 4 (subunit M)
MLFILILLPLFGAFFLCFVNRINNKSIRNFGLFWSLLILNFCCATLFFFDPTIGHFQFVETNNWFSAVNINCIFGVDGLALILIIGFYGSRQRKIRSAYMLFLYTLFSSLIMFLAILYIYFKFGSTDYLFLKTIIFEPTTEKLC